MFFFSVLEEKLVRVMGLEPTRPIEHKHLKLACLPIPAHSQMSFSTEDLLIIAYRGKKSRAFFAPRVIFFLRPPKNDSRRHIFYLYFYLSAMGV